MRKEKILIDFNSQDKGLLWEVIDDVVMGGISKSRLSITPDKTALFQGSVSLEHSGGFASTRTYPQDFQLEGFRGLMIRIRGDGRKYRLRLRTDNAYDGIAYQAHFPTDPDRWAIVRLAFSEFTPVFRGEVIAGAPALEINQVRRIGFMIADKQEGHFSLEIDCVKAYT
ncbi:CIA30 family protein [bacterium]|nr:MAG: CIA30 family protein [bacterium]